MSEISNDTRQRLIKFKSSDQYSKLSPETKSRVDKFVGEGPGLAFKRDSIPFSRPEGVVEALNPVSQVKHGLQNMGALAQREEAALAGAGEEALSGRFKNIPKEFMRGIKGEQTTEFGDLARRRGVGEDASQAIGFGASMVTPTNAALTALTGGTNKLLTPSMVKPITKPISKVPGILARFAANVETKPVKDLRNIMDRIGAGKLFGGGVETPEYVGRELAPRMSKLAKEGVESLDPNALRAIGVPEDVIDDAVRVKSEYGLKKMPSIEEADDFFESVIKQDPFDGEIKPEQFRRSLEGSIANLESGLGKDHSVVKSMRFMLDGLDRSPSSAESIRTGVGKIGRSLTKDEYLGTRRDINRLFTNNKEIDMFVQKLKETLDSDAAQSGITGTKRARDIYRVSREVTKARNFVDKADLLSEKGAQSQLLSAQDPKRVVEKDIIKSLTGTESGEILDLLQGNKILTTSGPEGIGRTKGSGIISSIRDLARRGIRGYEEKVRPVAMRVGEKVGKKTRKLRDVLKRPAAMSERRALINSLKEEDE